MSYPSHIEYKSNGQEVRSNQEIYRNLQLRYLEKELRLLQLKEIKKKRNYI